MIRDKTFNPERSRNAIDRGITKLDRIRLFGSIRTDEVYPIPRFVETASSSGGIKSESDTERERFRKLSDALRIQTTESSASSNSFIFIPRVLARNYPTYHGGLKFFAWISFPYRDYFRKLVIFRWGIMKLPVCPVTQNPSGCRF